MKRLASIVVVVMLALSTPAKADDNPIKGLIILNNLIKKLQNIDIKYEIDRTIQHNLEVWSRNKVYEKRLKQGGKNI
jgi:hypothetical protein